jgi:hypothetical protein
MKKSNKKDSPDEHDTLWDYPYKKISNKKNLSKQKSTTRLQKIFKVLVVVMLAYLTYYFGNSFWPDITDEYAVSKFVYWSIYISSFFLFCVLVWYWEETDGEFYGSLLIAIPITYLIFIYLFPILLLWAIKFGLINLVIEVFRWIFFGVILFLIYFIGKLILFSLIAFWQYIGGAVLVMLTIMFWTGGLEQFYVDSVSALGEAVAEEEKKFRDNMYVEPTYLSFDKIRTKNDDTYFAWFDRIDSTTIKKFQIDDKGSYFLVKFGEPKYSDSTYQTSANAWAGWSGGLELFYSERITKGPYIRHSSILAGYMNGLPGYMKCERFAHRLLAGPSYGKKTDAGEMVWLFEYIMKCEELG